MVSQNFVYNTWKLGLIDSNRFLRKLPFLETNTLLLRTVIFYFFAVYCTNWWQPVITVFYFNVKFMVSNILT